MMQYGPETLKTLAEMGEWMAYGHKVSGQRDCAHRVRCVTRYKKKANHKENMNPIHYEMAPDGVSIRAHRDKEPLLAPRVWPSHINFSKILPAVQTFNRGVKRGDTILVTGDRPRFALMRTYPEDKLDPDLIKLGDGRIRLRCQCVEAWLDECDTLDVVFHPGSTDYQLHFEALPQLNIALLVSQARDWGLAARLTVTYCGEDAAEIGVEFHYGGLHRCERTHDAAYFQPDETDGTKNQVMLSADWAVIADEHLEDAVTLSTYPRQSPAHVNGKIRFRHVLDLHPGETQSLYLVAGRAAVGADLAEPVLSTGFNELIAAAQEYYEHLLAQAVISTPSPILDAGFRTAALNLDNVYAGKAWLEGVHWWSAYWTNNYQISAALALGQIERARKALDFYDSPDAGPCPVMNAAGKPSLGQMNSEDGLPYYIYTLCQYYHQTGDASLLEKVWPHLVASIQRMFIVRAGAGQGLLDWHLGCNAFLCQADHLGMPGEAASPSLMMAGMLERLAQVALHLGKGEDADRWQALAARMVAGLRQRLWNAEAGAFYGHIDLQGIRHMAHYYTDLVFPALYTSLPEEYGWLSLAYLRRTLWVERELPEPPGRLALMRVGDFKPPIFGNDNIMPVQMAEAARAFFKTGQNEEGFHLLESVAWAGTLHTEAPGNFPEHMSEDGKGEANYLFGNPIGSFIFSVVDGLFGLSWTNGGETIDWQPAFPQGWEHANLDLPYVRLAYRAENQDEQRLRHYRLETPGVKKLAFKLDLPAGKVEKMVWNGQAQEFELKPAPGHLMRLSFTAPAAAVHAIEVSYRVNVGMDQPEAINPTPSEAAPRYSLADPSAQALLQQMRAEHMQPVDLSALFNTSILHVTSAWRNVDLPIRLAPVKGSLLDFFHLPGSGDSLVMVEYGRSHPYSRRTEPSQYPRRVVVPIGQAAQALTLLYASELESRHTGARVGTLRLVYAGGAVTEVPLVAGENLDTLFRHWAADTLPIPLQGNGFRDEDYLNLYRLPCDPGRVLLELVIELDAPDVQVGLLAANITLA
jgi:hypothetical protein